MARIDIRSNGGGGSVATGVLQLQGGVAMTSTLTAVTDQNNTTSPLKLSTTAVQVVSPLRITTSDASGFYLDAEDSATNNRFSIKRDPSSQLVTLDFASNPAGSTTAVGAIRTYVDGVNLSEVMAFREDGQTFVTGNTTIGNGTTAIASRLAIKGSGSTVATTSLLVQNSLGDSSFQVNDSQLVQGFSGSLVRFKLGFNGTTGQAISTRDGQFAIGLIDTDQLAAIRFLTLGTGASYIDAYSEGTSKAANYPLFIGSRTNNTSTSVTGSTTEENGTRTVFGSAVSDASALVQVNSTTRGFLPPRMTTAQKNAIATPAAGLMVYDTNLNKLCVYTTAWETITSL